MIKKILIVAVLLLAVAAPVVLADAGPAPEPSHGEFIQVKCSALTKEAAIGEDFAIELTITNQTRYKISLQWMSFGLIGLIEGLEDSAVVCDDENLELDAYEVITLQITDRVYSDINWYRDGEYYYADLIPDIMYTIDWTNEIFYYYEKPDTGIPIRITNLYDGSEYFSIEWLDSREIFYYSEYYAENYYDNGVGQMFLEGYVCYQMNFINDSDAEVYGNTPYQDRIINDTFNRMYFEDEITDVVEFIIRPIAEIDGNYYCIESKREYITRMIDIPDISIEVDIDKPDTQSPNADYTVSVTNTGSASYDNLVLLIRNKYGDNNISVIEQPDNIAPGETVGIEFNGINETYINYLCIGYLLDGMIYCRHVECSAPSDNFETVKTAEINPDVFFCFDYEFEESLKEQTAEWQTFSAETATPTTELTAQPSPTVTAKVTAVISPTVTVSNRQNPMIWALVCIIALLAAAVVFIIRVIIKLDRENKE